MISGYDKYGPEHSPPRQPRSLKERIIIWIVLAAAIAVGSWLASALT